MKNLYVALRASFLAGLVVALSCTNTAAQISGTVYRDFDASGTRTVNRPNEPGVPRVVVNAWVNFATAPVSVTTDIAGNYAFSAGQVPPQAAVRLEFTALEDGFFFGPVGGQSQSNLRFLTAPATAIDCGINYPSEYCQNGNVPMLIPCFVKGDPLTTTNANGPVAPADQSRLGDVLVMFAVDASGLADAGNFPPAHLATAGEIGSVWGVTYLRKENKAISAATIKRHAGLGALGTGGIYLTDIVSATTTPFFDFQADLNVPTGANPHSGLDANKNITTADPGPMRAVGRMGLGGIDLSTDNKTLYAVNMLDRRLYGVFIDSPVRKPSPADVKSWAIDQSGCPNGDFRPWGVYVYRKHVYVGGVCSGENRTSRISQYTSATGALGATLPDTAGLKAIVMRMDPRQGPSASFQTVLSFPLTFKRGAPDRTNDCAAFTYWLPWTNEFPVGCNSTGESVLWPQPMLTDLAFDDNGDMVIGMLDRFGHLGGNKAPDPNGQGIFNGLSSGDLLRASVNNPEGTAYTLESNGSVGGRTAGSNVIPGSGQTVIPPYTPTGGTFRVQGVGNQQGPGGGEFYFNDQWFFNAGNNIAHDETTNGSVMIRPGSNEVTTSAFDPITDLYQSAGIKVFNNTDGTIARNYALYAFDADGTFGKVSGLGDGKLMCDVPPIEIGNRVWFDDNRNGIQDAYERGIAGVRVALFDMSTADPLEVSSIFTDSGGGYAFNNANVTGGLQYEKAYQIRLDRGQLAALDLSANGQVTGRPMRGYMVSPVQQGTTPGSSTRDNNAVAQGNTAVVNLTTGSFGENNYDYDLSIYACPQLDATVASVTVCAGTPAPALTMKTTHTALVDKVQFVYFTSPQSGTAMYVGGTDLGTFAPANVASSTVSLTAPALPTANATGGDVTYYVYGIVSPMPQDPQCRTSALTSVVVKPEPQFVDATGGLLLCDACSVTLTVTANGNVTYAWSGPNGFSSSQQNPVVSTEGYYSITITNPTTGCSATERVLVERAPAMDPCPSVSSEQPTAITVCAGGTVPDLTVTGTLFAPGEQVKFVLFESPRTATSVHSGGVTLATQSLDAQNRTTLPGSVVAAQLTALSTAYVYAIVVPNPNPANGPSCSTMASFQLTVLAPACIPVQVLRLK